MKRKAQEDLSSPAAPKRVKHSDSEEPREETPEDKDEEQIDVSINAPIGGDTGGDDGDGDEAGADDEDGADDKDEDKEEKEDEKDGEDEDEDKDDEKDGDKKVKTEDGDEPDAEDQSAPTLKRIPFPDKVCSRHCLGSFSLANKCFALSRVSSKSAITKSNSEWSTMTEGANRSSFSPA